MTDQIHAKTRNRKVEKGLGGLCSLAWGDSGAVNSDE